MREMGKACNISGDRMKDGHIKNPDGSIMHIRKCESCGCKLINCSPKQLYCSFCQDKFTVRNKKGVFYK